MALCPDCGAEHHPELAEAAAEIDTAEVIAEGAADAAHEEHRADVEVAQIEADAAVELARINAKVEAGWQEARVAELEGQVAGMREIIGRLTEPPEPPPAPDPPEPEVIEEEPPPPEEEPPPPAPKKSKGWWG